MRILILLLLLSTVYGVQGQCTRISQWGNHTVSSMGQTNMSTTVGTNNYSEITLGADKNGHTFIFGITRNSTGTHKYMTIRTVGGTLLQHGFSPQTWVNTGNYTAIRIHWSEDAACATATGNHTSTVDWQGPLPIELRSINVESKGTFNEIKWTTDTESNNEWQIIESSTNHGRDWNEVGRVKGTNTSEQQNYSVIDKYPKTVTYYRLYSIDFDGYGQYSNIVVARRKGDESQINIINLGGSTLKVYNKSHEKDTYEVQILSSAGGTIISKTVFDGEEINIETLHTGLYFVTAISKKSGDIKLVKIVK